MSTPPEPKCQIIKAPSHEPPHAHNKTLFLAGSTTDWRPTLIASLADQPQLTIYDPVRPDWDAATWREDVTCAPFREQTEWELERQEAADVVVVYFDPGTRAPVSLLEFGLCAKEEGKALVVCPEGYWKRGNVQVVCQRYGIGFLEGVGEVRGRVLGMLGIE